MNARAVTERLIWLKQHALGNRTEAPRIRAAYIDELHSRAAQLGYTSRSDPDYAARLIDVLVTEIAHTRNRLGLVTDPHLDAEEIDA